MLRQYTIDQAAEKLGIDLAELRFLLLHFKEFLGASTSVDGVKSFSDADIMVLKKAYAEIQTNGQDPADVRASLRARQSGVSLSGGCQGGILAFVSGRPQTGKSSLVFNIAVALAEKGFRTTIFDGAIGSGGVSELLQPPDDCPWQVQHDSGVRVICGEALAGCLDKSSDSFWPDDVLRQVQEIDDTSDFILVDTGLGRSDAALRYAMAVDEIIDVSTSDVGANADCFAVIRMLKDVDPDLRVSLLINRAVSLNEAREAFARINGAASKIGLGELGAIGWVMEDMALRRYLAEGVAVVERVATSPAAKCIHRVADHLAHRLTPVSRRGGGRTLALVQGLRSSLNRGGAGAVIS